MDDGWDLRSDAGSAVRRPRAARRGEGTPAVRGPRRFGVGLLIPAAAAAAAVVVTVLLMLFEAFGRDSATATRTVAARGALELLAKSLARVPPERRAAVAAKLTWRGPGTLRLVGPGAAGPARPENGANPPWPSRVGPDGGTVCDGGRAEAGCLLAVPLPGSADGVGLALRLPPGRTGGRGGLGFGVFGLLVVAVSLLPAVLLSQRLARDLRRLERGVAGVVAEDPPDAGAASLRLRPWESDDELAWLAWTYESLHDRFAEEVQRYRRARSRVARADQDKVDFLAVMSHELRTPLNTILGFSDLLLQELEGPLRPGQREDLRIIRDSGDHLLSLVNDILDLSALRAGQIRAEFVEVDLVALGRMVLEEAEGQRRDKPVRLAGDFPAERLAVRADPRLLRRVLQNVVGNALKFTPQGEVRLTIRRAGEWAEMEIRDTGPGIDPEALERIFEAYEQAGDARTRREGTGLGLAIARQFVELHGGRIEARSRLGHGSVFTVRIPVAGPPTEAGGA